MWYVSVPVWGERYRKVFLERALPSILYAAQGASAHVYITIHKDGYEGDAFEKSVKQLCSDYFNTSPYTLSFVQVANNSTYVALQQSHAEVINFAGAGSLVMLLNADIVVSGNLFEKCEQHLLDRGKNAVVCLGIRTVLDDQEPPIGAPPRELLNWAWEHRHQIIRDLEWGSGRSALPTNLFFSPDVTGGVVARGFHLHPVAIRKPKVLSFRSTIDGDLLDSYERDTIHVVTDVNDVAILEQSPADKRFPLRNHVLDVREVAGAMRNRSSDLHRWQFAHRIYVKRASLDDTPPLTDAEVTAAAKLVFYDDVGIARDILSILGTRTTFHRQL